MEKFTLIFLSKLNSWKLGTTGKLSDMELKMGSTGRLLTKKDRLRLAAAIVQEAACGVPVLAPAPPQPETSLNDDTLIISEPRDWAN